MGGEFSSFSRKVSNSPWITSWPPLALFSPLPSRSDESVFLSESTARVMLALKTMVHELLTAHECDVKPMREICRERV